MLDEIESNGVNTICSVGLYKGLSGALNLKQINYYLKI